MTLRTLMLQSTQPKSEAISIRCAAKQHMPRTTCPGLHAQENTSPSLYMPIIAHAQDYMPRKTQAHHCTCTGQLTGLAAICQSLQGSMPRQSASPIDP